MRLILMGAPGAGKGTQAEILCKELKVPTISTGNILRAAMKERTPLGEQVKGYMNKGMLVPDDIIIDVICQRLKEGDCKNGYILDGVPRTIPQAEAMEQNGIVIDAVVSLEVDDEVITKRMSGRRVCERCGTSYHIVAIPPKVEGVCDSCGGTVIQRNDDKPETVKARLEIYHRQTKPLEIFYEQRGLLKRVENQPSVGETTQAIFNVLGR